MAKEARKPDLRDGLPNSSLPGADYVLDRGQDVKPHSNPQLVTPSVGGTPPGAATKG